MPASLHFYNKFMDWIYLIDQWLANYCCIIRLKNCAGHFFSRELMQREWMLGLCHNNQKKSSQFIFIRVLAKTLIKWNNSSPLYIQQKEEFIASNDLYPMIYILLPLLARRIAKQTESKQAMWIKDRYVLQAMWFKDRYVWQQIRNSSAL